MATEKTLLSNPVLDNLYAIRRILVGQWSHFASVTDRQFETKYYKDKVDAMDAAISAFIEVTNVPVEHTEKTIPLPEAGVRVPGDNFISSSLRKPIGGSDPTT